MIHTTCSRRIVLRNPPQMGLISILYILLILSKNQVVYPFSCVCNAAASCSY